MAISARKSIDQTSLELKKQASVGRMLVQATVLYKQGMLRKVEVPTSRARSKIEPRRGPGQSASLSATRHGAVEQSLAPHLVIHKPRQLDREKPAMPYHHSPAFTHEINGTTSRNALVPNLNLDKDTPSDSVQATAQLCFELMCLHEKDFQTHLLLDATPTGRGWYADMQDVVWSRHPALAKTLRPIVELGCSCNERGEPASNPLDVYALARAPHHERAIPTWALPDLHA